MKLRHSVIIIALICSAIISQAQNLALSWAGHLGGLGSEYGYSIAVDGSGNVYTTGNFTGTADFDPGPGTFNLTASGSASVFVCKLDASGNFVWAKMMGGTGVAIGRAIAVDASGNVYTAGNFTGTADFDPGSPTVNLVSAGLNDIFISKLNASGNFVWAKQIGSTSNDIAFAIALDPSANVFTTGNYSGTVDFDPGAGTFSLTSNSTNTDIFVLKLDAGGSFLWAKSMGGTSADGGLAITTDAAGNAYTTGNFAGTADFDPGTGTSNLTSNGGSLNDIFVSKLDASGNYVWAKNMGGPDQDYGYGIALDAAGNIYTTGLFKQTSDFDPGTGNFDLTSAGINDVFVSKLDGSGNFVWAKQFGGTADDVGRAIDVDANSNVYTTGYYNGTADFDPGTGNYNLTSLGSADIFISKLDASGNFAWAGEMGDVNFDDSYSIAADAAGNVYSTGIFYGNVDFDPGIGTHTINTAGGYDVFVQKLHQCTNTSSSISITTCDSYTAPDGAVYTTAGTKTAVIANQSGCDSTITINLTLNFSSTNTISATACDSYTAPDNTVYTASGIITAVIPNSIGCDSTITVNLTIHNSTTSTISITTCDSYTAPDNTVYTASGIVTAIIPNHVGCDSTITINLTIKHSSTNTISAIACNSYTAPDGVVYTASGVVTAIIPNYIGCDSIITVNLAVGHDTSSTISVVACDIYTAPNGNTYNQSGIITAVIPSYYGCDSTITINLTIAHGTTNYIFAAACDSYTAPDGTVYTTTGLETAIIPNQYGCDSTITINLTVVYSSASSISPTACISYVSPSGNHVWTSSNTYLDTIPNIAGCDSVITVHLTINTVDITVANNNPTLTASAFSATYQWVDCNNGFAPITGETNQSYTATANGNYAVIVTQNGCTDTSACTSITGIGIIENNAADSYHVYPNPTNGILTITTDVLFDNASLKLMDVFGQLISETTKINGGQINIDLGKQANGIYFIEILHHDTILRMKVIKN